MNEQSEKIKKISVSIGGISYQLVSRENETYAREIARKADEMIRQIVQQHPSLSTMQAIILSMVNTIDALTKMSESLDEAKKKVETIDSRSAKEVENLKFKMTKAQHELFLLRNTDFELKKEILRINELNKQLELEIASLRQQKADPDSRLFEGLDPDNEPEDAIIAFSEAGSASEDPDEPADTDGSEDRAEPDDEGETEDISEMEEPDDAGMDEPEEIEEVEEILEFVEWAEDEDSPNPFAVPMHGSNKAVCPDKPFSGFRQPSLEDLFSE